MVDYGRVVWSVRGREEDCYKRASHPPISTPFRQSSAAAVLILKSTNCNIVQFNDAMSDNLPPDEIERRLALFLSIPAEVWTDVLKLCSRRVLVQNIAPACYRLKEISNKNVKNIHLIKNAEQFTDKLEADDPEANNQLRDLAANKCQLASQFRLIRFTMSNGKSKDVLRHSLDLVQGCRLLFDTNDLSANDKKIVFLRDCLNIVQSAKPVTIRIHLKEDDPNLNKIQDSSFWLHPAVQQCRRVLFDMTDLFVLRPNVRMTVPDLMGTYMAIADWLHHRPNSDANGADQQVVRCLILWDPDHTHGHIDWLLNRCSEKLQTGQQPTDRRPFVFSFLCDSDWAGFEQFRRVENESTGEVLVLDRVMPEDENDEPTYRLRRCLAEEEAGGPEFYAGIFFKRYDGFEMDQFNNIVDKTTPTVIIGHEDKKTD